MIVVKIYLWGKYVGALIEDGNNISFEYDKKFRDGGNSISPLNLPLRDDTFSFPELLRKDAFLGLPGVFADCLPDKFGNKIVEKILRDQGLNPFSQAQKLLYVGKRGMGALEFEPASAVKKNKKMPLNIRNLVEESRKVIQGDITAKTAEIMQVGSTAGGMRAKAVIGWNKKTNDVIHGLGHLPKDYESWILKFDGVEKKHEPWCTLEYVYMRLAKKAGIKTPDVHLLKHEGLKHFMIKRFDRVNGEKVHMHSLGGLIHSDYNDVGTIDYKDFMTVAKTIGCIAEDAREIFKRMVFNILAINHDDHVKNFSFLMDKNGQWGISPAYDMTYIQGGKWTKGHQITCNGKENGINWEDMKTVAELCGILDPLTLAQEVEHSLQGFAKEAITAGLSAAVIKKVQRELKLNVIPSKESSLKASRKLLDKANCKCINGSKCKNPKAKNRPTKMKSKGAACSYCKAYEKDGGKK